MRSHFLFTNWMLELGNVHQSPCLICIGHPCYRYMRYLSAENDGTELRRSMGLSPKVHINCTSSFFFFVFPFLVLGSFGCLLCIQTGESYRVFLMALFWWVGRIRTTVRRADNRSRESGKKNKTNENKHATTTSAAAAAAAAATTTKQKGKSRNLLTNRWLMVLKRQSVEVPSDYLPLSLNGWTAFSRAKIGKRRKETEKKSGK